MMTFLKPHLIGVRILQLLCLTGVFMIPACSAQSEQGAGAQETFIRHGIDSAYLPGRERAFHVQLPPGYFDKPDQNFPILFHLIASGQHVEVTRETALMLAKDGQAPEMIIVHLHHDPRNDADIEPVFDGTNGQADAYLDYLEKEAIPLIASEYRASEDLVFAGWSHFGPIAIYALTQKPDLFSGYIVRSAKPGSDPAALLDKMDMMLSGAPVQDLTLHLSIGDEDDSERQDFFENMQQRLNDRAPESFHWTTQIYEGADEATTYQLGLVDGITFYFSDENESKRKERLYQRLKLAPERPHGAGGYCRPETVADPVQHQQSTSRN